MVKSNPYEHLHKEEDRSFKINDLDLDRKTIVLSLPAAPKRKDLIDGWNLPTEEQYFRRLEIPKRLKSLEVETIRELQDIQRNVNKQEAVTGAKIIEKFWSKIEDNPEEHEDEIAFIHRLWWHRFYGYWFYNDGQPTYITGRHFMFLNFFYQPDITFNGGLPEYRDRHRREYLFRDYLRTSTESFARRDEKGMAIPEDDGTYVMQDIGMRIFFGDIHPKSRRNGSTMMSLGDMIEDTEKAFGIYSTIVSKDGDSTEAHYTKKLLPAWSSRPYFMKPVWQGSASPNQIKYFGARNSFSGEFLMGTIDYTVSASEIKQDGNKINGMLVCDEEGKCLRFGTEVLLYDGSIKNVEDIIEGDLLMGDDATPRTVTGCVRGFGKMYRVDSKFGTFFCNSKHVLSLRSSYTHRGGFPFAIGADRIANIPIEDFIRLSDSQKRNLKLYRAPILYSEKVTKIDPYLLGVWLGDGSHAGSAITMVDGDLIRYFINYAEDSGMNFAYNRDNITMSLSTNVGTLVNIYDWTGVFVRSFPSLAEAGNEYHLSGNTIAGYAKSGRLLLGKYIVKVIAKKPPFSNLLSEEGLIKNKHIPINYMQNSTHSRMELLAGIIDTDGSRHSDPNKLCYEVTQKREELARQIQQLANSLGFYATISDKVARMKREDGTYYECSVFRVRIYGDVYNIPLRIERKRYLKPDTWRNRNPNVSWLKVSEAEDGWYAGFSLDGNHLFMLANQIVTHNTENADVLSRHNVNKNAQSLGDGSIIIGYSSHISTVEDITQAGQAFLDLLDQSDFYQRGDNGQTLSGLAAMFFPAYDGLEGFIDRFGRSVIENPTERQSALSPDSIFARLCKGARQYQQEKRDEYTRRGTPSALKSLREYIKKYPWRSSELYMGTSGDLGFNYEKMDSRLAELRKIKSLDNLPLKYGNFYRVNNDPEGAVFWRTEPDKAKFILAMELPHELTNLKRQGLGWDVNKQDYVPMYEPVRKTKFTVGADPVEFNNDDKAGGSRQSDGGIAVLWEHDSELDRSENPADWDSRRCVCYYRYRPSSLQEYCEDVLMVAEYFSCLIFPENNKTRLWEYIIERGRGGFLKYQIDPRTGKRADKPGYYASEPTKNTLFGEWKDYIEKRIHKEIMIDLIEEARNIRSMKEMNKYDGFAAFGAALMGSMSPDGKAEERFANLEIDLGGCSFLQSRPM